MKKSRLYYIDTLRIIAILLMYFYHINMIFVAENDWHIKDSSTSNVLLEVNYWMASFRMPLLFLVSGFISTILLERFTRKEFVIQRFKRLIVPIVIWTFILVAPQIYFERKLEGSDFTYLEFYSTFLEFKWYPQGNFHWLHLWFIPYLFFYNILSIPFINIISREKIRQKLEKFFSKDYSILLIILISIIPNVFLVTHFPTTHDLINDWSRHSFFIFFILTGVIFYKFPQILANIENKRRLYLRLSILLIITINTIRWNGWEPFQIWGNWIEKPQTYFYLSLLNINSWIWVITCLGYGRKYLNIESKFLYYCNQAIYPFYILHQTVIVVLAYYVVQTPDNTALKYGFLLICCLLLTILIYHLFIRPYNFMRQIFGMK